MFVIIKQEYLQIEKNYISTGQVLLSCRLEHVYHSQNILFGATVKFSEYLSLQSEWHENNISEPVLVKSVEFSKHSSATKQACS